MNHMTIKYGLCLLSALILSACTVAKVNIHVVSERTSLENQVLGTYHSLDEDMTRVASVRAVDSSGQIKAAPPRSQDHKDGLLAMQILAFYEDDLEVFKQIRWVGENNKGLVTLFWKAPEQLTPEIQTLAKPYQQAEVQSIVSKLNAARKRVMQRVIALNESFSDDDLPKIQQVFASSYQKMTQTGELIQLPKGHWINKP